MAQKSENCRFKVKAPWLAPGFQTCFTEAGFTLIEVMIAMVVLVLGLLALAQLQVAAIKGLTYSRHFSVATQLAQSQMEKLMSYPFSEKDASTPDYCPLDKDGHPILVEDTGGTQRSPFYDGISVSTLSGYTISTGDGNATRLWLPDPVNELGQPAQPNENSYLVTWTVERGGTEGTNPLHPGGYGIPGPYEVRLVVTAIWFEKGDNLTAKSDHKSFVNTSTDELVAGRRSTIEGMRELTSGLK
jgi:prepilin-type N-terminal cleavage/methylation domain-containing protein